MAKRWYVVHAYSGYEKHVMRSLIERVKLAGMEDDFGEILVPTEEVVEMRNGQKRKSERKFFPWLCTGPDGDERRDLALGQGHPSCDGLYWRYCRQACADHR